jgi:hypothetical protein
MQQAKQERRWAPRVLMQQVRFLRWQQQDWRLLREMLAAGLQRRTWRAAATPDCLQVMKTLVVLSHAAGFAAGTVNTTT